MNTQGTLSSKILTEVLTTNGYLDKLIPIGLGTNQTNREKRKFRK